MATLHATLLFQGHLLEVVAMICLLHEVGWSRLLTQGVLIILEHYGGHLRSLFVVHMTLAFVLALCLGSDAASFLMTYVVEETMLIIQDDSLAQLLRSTEVSTHEPWRR